MREQDIYVDVKVKVDFSQAILFESLGDTLNYVLISDLCTRIAQEKKSYLIETLAKEILDQLFRCFKVSWAWIAIKKPSAILTAQYAFVELERFGE